jgi:hypothetical protein
VTVDSGGAERRGYERYYFGSRNEVQIHLQRERVAEPIVASVVNVSLGGVGLFFAHIVPGIWKQTEFEVLRIVGPQELEGLVGRRIVVRWVIGVNVRDGGMCGCQFLDPPTELVTRVSELIEKLAARSLHSG